MIFNPSRYTGKCQSLQIVDNYFSDFFLLLTDKTFLNLVHPSQMVFTIQILFGITRLKKYFSACTLVSKKAFYVNFASVSHAHWDFTTYAIVSFSAGLQIWKFYNDQVSEKLAPLYIMGAKLRSTLKSPKYYRKINL